jgi:hypothetical protein
MHTRRLEKNRGARPRNPPEPDNVINLMNDCSKVETMEGGLTALSLTFVACLLKLLRSPID